MSTPFGVDLGNANTVIACARNRGIDIIVNEVSNRSTPSIIGFGPRNRFIGETGKNQQTSNLKNTVENFKRFLGLPDDHPDVPIELKYTTAELVSDPSSKTVGAQVNYLANKTIFNSIQLSAMYLNKIKDITVKETKANIHDICLAVPVWYTEKQRRAAADACHIAGLNPVRIVNEVTAAAVSYGVFKANDLPEDEPRRVAFVDIGHSSLQVAIAAVKKGELKILGSGYDKHFGGRDFDHAIAQHFAGEFKDKYKIDVTSNPKAFYRILTAAEKLKKVLSANTSAPFGVESVMNDVDVSSSMTRDQLEEYVQPLLNRIHVPIEVALKDAGLKPEDLDSVEVVGGCTRVPSLKAKLAEIFNQPLSFTLNQDEAVARGAAFICAMHSPTLRVRPFKFEDFNPYSVSYFWDKEDEDEDHLEVFPRGGLFPSTKLITLYRSGDSTIEAKYTSSEELPKGTDLVIGKWELKGIVPSEGEKSIATKIKLRNDPSGFYTIESAYTVEDKLVKELIEKEPKPEGEAKEGEEEEEEEKEEEPQYKEVKKTVKKNDVTIVANTSALVDAARVKFEEQEGTMSTEDKLVADTEDKKNALEEYIYDLRGKLEEQYKDFASEAEKEKLSGMLLKTEDWLYDEGYDSTKAKYIAKYEELASLGNLIRGRYLAKEEERKQNLRLKQEKEKTAKLAEEMAKNRKEPKEGDDVEMKD